MAVTAIAAVASAYAQKEQSRKAANAAKDASKAQLAGQQTQLDYLKERDAVTNRTKDASLKGLGGLYGLPGFDNTIDLANVAMESPIYKAMSGQIDQSLADNENQAGANASASGFLRSGVLADALAKYRERAGVDKASALGSVYNQYLAGIQSLAGAPTNANQIGNVMGQMGETNAAGQLATGQIQANKLSDMFNSGVSGAKTGNQLSEYMKTQGISYSDIRLKENIQYIGELFGHRWFKWKWNKEAEKLGLKGNGEGVMAHLVQKYAPNVIGENSGYMTVNYNAI